MFVCLLPCSFYLVPFEHNKISMEEYKHEDFPDDIQEPLLQKMEVEDAITPPMPKNGTADGPKDITLEDVMEEIRSLKLLVVEVKNKQETQEKGINAELLGLKTTFASIELSIETLEVVAKSKGIGSSSNMEKESFKDSHVLTGHERFLKDIAQIGSKRKADDEVEIIGHKVAGVDEYEQVFNDGSSSVLGEVDSIENLAVGATVSKRPITSLVSSPFVPGIWLKPESANNTKKSATQSSLITKSDYKRHPHFKQTTPTLVVEGMTKKKLTFPPSPKATPGQYSKSNLRGNQSMKKEKEVAKSIEGTKKKCKNSGEVTPTPKDRDTKTLSPHRAMIAKRDAQVVSFLFQKSLDTKLRNEVLVWSMGYEGSRGELQCLIPNRPITDLVITLAAARITDRQTETWRQAVWCLPPSFVVDMESGMTLPDIREKYCKKWMTPYTNLQFIYIPMKCVQDHWLLMIVDVAAGISYRLDTFCPLGCTEPRHIRMKKLGLLLYHLLNDAHYSIAFRNKRINLQNYEIVEQKGLPNVGNSLNSGVWVLDWINKEHFFNTKTLLGTLNEKEVRMRTAVDLMLGDHNGLRLEVLRKTEAFFNGSGDS